MRNCPRCGLEFDPQLEVQSEVESGGLSLSGSEIGFRSDPEPPASSKPPVRARRGKAREYSTYFETAWKAYGRREEKLRAYGEWIAQARQLGGETLLLPQILDALRWQCPMWDEDGWNFAPYFERYLKRRKWEDERPPQRAPQRQAVPFAVRAEEERSSRKHQSNLNVALDQLARMRGGK